VGAKRGRGGLKVREQKFFQGHGGGRSRGCNHQPTSGKRNILPLYSGVPNVVQGKPEVGNDIGLKRWRQSTSLPVPRKDRGGKTRPAEAKG